MSIEILDENAFSAKQNRLVNYRFLIVVLLVILVYTLFLGLNILEGYIHYIIIGLILNILSAWSFVVFIKCKKNIVLFTLALIFVGLHLAVFLSIADDFYNEDVRDLHFLSDTGLSAVAFYIVFTISFFVFWKRNVCTNSKRKNLLWLY